MSKYIVYRYIPGCVDTDNPYKPFYVDRIDFEELIRLCIWMKEDEQYALVEWGKGDFAFHILEDMQITFVVTIIDRVTDECDFCQYDTETTSHRMNCKHYVIE